MILQSRPSVRAIALVLALLSPYTAQAQSPADLHKDQSVCSAVAQTVLSANPSGGWRSPWQQPLRALAKAPGGIVSIDAEGWRAETKAQALDRLRQNYRAASSLTEAIGRLMDDSGTFSLYRFGASSLGMAESVGGTASCQSFVFFDAPPAGAAHAVAAPPVVQNAEPFTFCVKTTGYAGEVAGVPAFVVETDRDSTVELSFTPWRDGGWQGQCKVVIRFSDVFEMTDRFCRDVDCNAMAEQALSLTKKVDQASQTAPEFPVVCFRGCGRRYPNRGPDEAALNPCVGPIFENGRLLERFVESRDKTPFSVVLVCGQQEREQIQGVHVLLKNLAKVAPPCVLSLEVDVA